MILGLSILAGLVSVVWVVYSAIVRASSWLVPWKVVAATQLAMLSMVGWKFAGSSGGSTTLRLVLIGLALSLLAAESWRAGSVWLGRHPSIALYVIVVFASGLASSDKAAALSNATRVVVMLLTFQQVTAILPTFVVRRILAEFLGGLGTLFAASAMLAWRDAFAPIRSPFFDYRLEAPAILQGAAVVGLVGLGVLVIAATGNGRVLLRWLAAAGGVALVLFTQRRMFYLAGLAGVLSWLGLMHRRWLRPLIVAAVIVVAVGLLVPSVRPLWDRESAHPESANIVSYRTEVFEESLNRFTEHPVIGGGLGVGDEDLVISIGTKTWPSHSEVGAALAATGVLGATALAWAYGAAIFLAWRRWKDTSDWMPVVVMAMTVVLLPFVVVLGRMSVLALPYLCLLLPLFPKSRVPLRSRRMA